MARITLDQAERSWLAACDHISEATRTSYVGEARRFREHLAKAKIDVVHNITEAAWLAYLTDLTEARSTVASKRTDALKVSSALQAARITRSFLRHCWMQRWLDWVPGVGNLRCPPDGAPPVFQAPDGLVGFLLDSGELDDEVASRTRCAVGLAFWGGFRPKEIAELRGRDLVPAEDGGAVLHPAWRADGVVLPAIMMLQLKHYMALRVARTGPLTSNSALIAQLMSKAPVSASAAWRLLKDWTVAQAPADSSPISTRAIRESFKQLAGAEASDYIGAIERQSVSRHRRGQSAQSRMVGTQQVTSDLLNKMNGSAAVL